MGSSVSHAFKEAVRAAAKWLRANKRTRDARRIQKASFHTLRHTFASWLIQAGVPIAKVQQYLGHSSGHMTRRYAHLAPSTFKYEIERGFDQRSKIKELRPTWAA